MLLVLILILGNFWFLGMSVFKSLQLTRKQKRRACWQVSPPLFSAFRNHAYQESRMSARSARAAPPRWTQRQLGAAGGNPLPSCFHWWVVLTESPEEMMPHKPVLHSAGSSLHLWLWLGMLHEPSWYTCLWSCLWYLQPLISWLNSLHICLSHIFPCVLSTSLNLQALTILGRGSGDKSRAVFLCLASYYLK